MNDDDLEACGTLLGVALTIAIALATLGLPVGAAIRIWQWAL